MQKKQKMPMLPPKRPLKKPKKHSFVSTSERLLPPVFAESYPPHRLKSKSNRNTVVSPLWQLLYLTQRYDKYNAQDDTWKENRYTLCSSKQSTIDGLSEFMSKYGSIVR